MSLKLEATQSPGQDLQAVLTFTLEVPALDVVVPGTQRTDRQHHRIVPRRRHALAAGPAPAQCRARPGDGHRADVGLGQAFIARAATNTERRAPEITDAARIADIAELDAMLAAGRLADEMALPPPRPTTAVSGPGVPVPAQVAVMYLKASAEGTHSFAHM